MNRAPAWAETPVDAWERAADIWVPLPPLGKQRHRTRVTVKADDAVEMRTYTPAQTRAWSKQAALVLGAHARAAGLQIAGPHAPVRVDVAAWFTPPARPKHPRWVVVKPDRDNVDKLVLDALKVAGVLPDDAQVCSGQVDKLYAPQGQAPGVRVQIFLLGAAHGSV